MKDPDLRTMNRADLEDEVMLQRAKVKVLENALAEANRYRDILGRTPGRFGGGE